ncbi:ATP-binding protein [Thiohalobacter sp. IOR34]|uniref:ATP-binding protein n=1 Tax=Thiohalobacter sp. IOR34 TaxID=3057176 RepID=UPI0025B19B1B|nr:ATP-binding protein [Thiohalobacter sp. IOR34]WJW76145.1 ATP-binding protein [Thiohalobacter sp. IOR34]
MILPRGIRNRILLAALLPAVTIAAVLGSYFAHTRIEDLNAALRDRGQAVAEQLAAAAEYGVFIRYRQLLNGLAEAALKDPDVIRIRIYDSNRTLLAEAQRTPPPEDDSQLLLFRADIHASDISIGDFGAEEDAGQNLQTKPIGQVEISLSNAATEARQLQALLTSLLITLSVILASILFALKISRSVAQPIVDLTRVVEALGTGDLRARAEARSTGELGTLEQGINAMAAELENVHAELQEQVEQATADLRETLEAVEIQNVELDLARKRALQASRDKTEFLASMSHEIRTPMNGLLGFVDLLLRTPLNEEQRDYTTTIRKSATNLLVIVNDILDLSKIESGKLSLEVAPFDLREALEDSVDLMAPVAHQKGLELVLLIYGDVPLQLYGDSNRIRQVLLNLVGNAIKFTSSGSVVVRVMLEDDADCPSDHTSLRISITDTGIGMTDEQQSRLFQAFSQADASLTRRFGGTGLGLFISRRLIEQMGGSIGVESQPAEGSTFWFTLKCPLQAEGELPDDEIRAPRRARILLFDTHPLARLAVRHPLEAWGLEVIEIEDKVRLQEAAARVADGRLDIDLILIGLSSQTSDDPQIAELLALFKPDGRPLLLLINSVERERLKKVVELGADACLPKPPRRESLRSTLWQLLGWAEPGSGGFVERRRTPRPEMPDLRGAHILLADDNEINRRLITLQLKSLGVQVDSAVDGTEALRLANHRRYDLILLDVHMPGMNGDEICRRLREGDGPNRRTPIIALTANIFSGDNERLRGSGIDEVLIKPVSEYRLWEVIRRWTHRHAGPPPEKAGRHQEVIATLREGLRRELPEQRLALVQAYQKRDWDLLQAEAHKLRGSAAYCQLALLEKAAASLEETSHAGNPAAVEAAFHLAMQAIDELLEEARSQEPGARS